MLPDVWLAYAEAEKDCTKDLLITPYRDVPPGRIVKSIRDWIRLDDQAGEGAYDIAHNEAVVAVRLTFAQLIKVTLALSPWWRQNAVFGKRRLTPEALKKPSLVRSLVAALEDLSWRQVNNEQMLWPPSGRSRPKPLSPAAREFTSGVSMVHPGRGINRPWLESWNESRERRRAPEELPVHRLGLRRSGARVRRTSAAGSEREATDLSDEPEPARKPGD